MRDALAAPPDIEQVALDSVEQIARIGSAHYDYATRELQWSDNLYRLLGAEPGAFAPLMQVEFERRFVHPDDRTLFRRLVSGTGTRVGEHERWRYRVIRLDGEVRTVDGRWRVERDTAGGPVRRVSIVHDVTDQVGAEAALRRSEARLVAAQQVAHIGDWEWVLPDGELVMSAEACRILGLSPADNPVTLERFERLVHPLDLGRLTGELSSVLADGGTFSVEYRIVRPDGEERVVVSAGRVVRDDGSWGIAGTVQDVTDRVRSEEQLRQAEKSEALGTLVAGVAHEFNNFLMAIGGSIELARASPESADQWLARGESSVRRAAEVVRQLLQVARREPPTQELVDVRTVVHEAVGLARATFDRRIALSADLSRDTPRVLADSGQLQQVLMNLLVNARDAVMERAEAPDQPSDFVPKVAVALQRAPRAEAGADGEQLVIVVTDNGVGIPPDICERIFDPFFTSKPPDRGTGLGLSTVQSIVAAHGGSIAVRSLPAGGTEFRISLPAAAEPGVATESAGPQPASARAESHGTILLVDDEDSVRDVAAAILQRAGYDVVSVDGGAEALARALRTPFDLVALDVNMPTPNGWETLDRLSEVQPGLPVLIVAGNATEADALDRGAVGLLEKPYARRELLHAVAHALAETPEKSRVAAHAG